MTNKASSFPAAPSIGPLHRHGGRIAALGELPIHALGDDYTVDGNGTVTRLPALASGITVWLSITGTPTFVNSAQFLVCPNGVDYAAQIGDLIIARSDGNGRWRLYVLSTSAAAPFDALAYNGMQVNGSMDVSQENGTSLVSAIASGKYIVDGYQIAHLGTMVLASQQVADAPPGLVNSIKVTVTTAEASMGSGDLAYIQTPIEGYRVSRLAFGGASAQSVSIGFWTKIHRIGTYFGCIQNSVANRTYPFSFTQNVSDTWEFKTVTIPGDTTGTWLMTNGVGLYLVFAIALGSTYSGAANVWAAASYIGVTGSINGVAATSDVFQITGVIVLPGIELPSAARAPLIMRPFDLELQLCKRYFEKRYVNLLFTATAGGQYCSTVTSLITKRASPTLSQTGISNTNMSAATLQQVTDPANNFETNALSTAVGLAQIEISVTAGAQL